jgi:hypothetical protein
VPCARVCTHGAALLGAGRSARRDSRDWSRCPSRARAGARRKCQPYLHSGDLAAKFSSRFVHFAERALADELDDVVVVHAAAAGGGATSAAAAAAAHAVEYRRSHDGER